MPIIIQHIKINGLDYKKKNQIVLVVFFIAFTLLVMLRHESIGKDTKNYMYYFSYFSSLDWKELFYSFGVEFGFAYYNKVVSLINKEQQFFLAVTAVITMSLIFPTYKRLCNDAVLTIVLFCNMSTFVIMFSGVRQGIAIAISFIAYEFVREKKVILFICMVLLAMIIHTSAFMLFLMYPAYHIRIKKKNLFIIIPAMVTVFVFNKPIFNAVTSLMAKYTKYDNTVSLTGAYSMLILFIIFAVFSFIIPDEKKMSSEIIGLRNFLLLATVIQMFAPLHSLAMRMNYYYIIFIPLLIPKIVEYRSNRWGQVAIVGRNVMVMFFIVYFFYSAYTSTNNLNVFPYHFFWERL